MSDTLQMRNNILTLILLLTIITDCDQKKMENKFIIWDNFVDDSSKEMVSAEDVFNKKGLMNVADRKLPITFRA